MKLSPPFVATPAETIKDLKNAIHFISNYSSKDAVDLGSGNGRIVIELAKLGIHTTGFESNKTLAEDSQKKIEELSINAQIYNKDYWKENLSSFAIVYIYGVPSIMNDLEKKLENELLKGSIVISNIYTFPHIKIKRKFGLLNLYIL